MKINNELLKIIQKLEDSSNKNDLIMNIGLLIEKNVSINPTNYAVLLPNELIDLELNSFDINFLTSKLINLIDENEVHTESIIWAIGKSLDLNSLEKALLKIFDKHLYKDKAVFKQIKFVVEDMSNENILEIIKKMEQKL